MTAKSLVHGRFSKPRNRIKRKRILQRPNENPKILRGTPFIIPLETFSLVF